MILKRLEKIEIERRRFFQCTSANRSLSILFTLLLYFYFQVSAHAFPEMIKHGYLNCNSCHHATGGGGLLTEYGRALSLEALTTWGTETEAKPFWGAIPESEHFELGGDFRDIQYYADTPLVRLGEFKEMQADFEAAAKFDKFKIIGTIGHNPNTWSGPIQDWILLRRHYVMYQPMDSLIFRAGKFLPNFGIGQAEHKEATRNKTFLDQDLESYNVEASFQKETFNVAATAILGRFDKPSLARRQGFSVTSNLLIFEHSKIGANLYYGANSGIQKWILGPHAIITLPANLQYFFETEFIISPPISGLIDSNTSVGVAHNSKLDYEPIQGLHFALPFEYYKQDFKVKTATSFSYGLSSQFFPRPHFDIAATYLQQKRAPNWDDLYHTLWFVGHIYL